MSILKDVLSELLSMFVADVRLTISILTVVGIAALIIDVTGLSPILGGIFLLSGCIAVLVFSVRKEAMRRRSVRTDSPV